MSAVTKWPDRMTPEQLNESMCGEDTPLELAMLSEIKDLRAALQAAADRQAQLEKDAERYRWLRDDSGAECAVADYWCSCDKKVEITDEAIDAAIAAQAQGGGNGNG